MDVSIVIPVFNESANLELLEKRLMPAARALGRQVEIIFIDDGSSDDSLERLKGWAARCPEVRVVELSRNFGQHAAIFAGFAQCRGAVIVTLDADLQNPPEEIGKLLAKIDEGYDCVGGWRVQREDSLLRKIPSRLNNWLTRRATGVHLHDYGSMLRAYRRPVVEAMLQVREVSSYIPVLANSFARRVCEVPVAHEERAAGESKYSYWKLINLQFDLVTSYSTWPLQLLFFVGGFIALLGLGLSALLLVRRFILGAEVEGVFTLFAILFFFVGCQFAAFGLLGEYIGRIYTQVRRRPKYIINKVHGGAGGEDAPQGRA
jgi:undecaprenyl-phosphate 4-deoxy-4-formamido-L-arabinose transferase